ncbi:ParB/RepB/Spo0J family partition protein [Kitasatospora sp. NPDC057223]|uniref:ParB/RepB/Spo0J family partition protein n=1 Tax=Kitasatospora sp. NPDC057223 TaxID=3346055 RepID=UPI0036364D36
MSTAAARVGAGSAFGNLGRTPRSERGRAKAQAEGLLPDYEIIRLQLDTVAPCPVNPRRSYGTDEQKSNLGLSLGKRQTTACVAVTREAYLKLWPNHASNFSAGISHVLLNGERRYRSALHVGLEALDFVVRDDLATSTADFIDNLLLENEDRENFNIIERARGIKQLLDTCEGNAAEVARRRGKDRSWVGNQVALLTLPDEIQERLITKDTPERYGRRLARALKDNPALSTQSLLALEEQLREEERTKRQADKALLAATRTEVLSADNTPAPSASAQPTSITPPPVTPPPAAPVAATPPPAGPATQPVLSADNTSSAAAARADRPSHDTPHPSPRPAKEVLSADNTVPVAAAAGTPPEVPRQSGSPDAIDVVTAQQRVRALGETPAEQAATLRAGLDEEQLNALVEVLYSLV